MYVLLGYLFFPVSPPPPFTTASSITVGCVPIHISVYVHVHCVYIFHFVYYVHTVYVHVPV